MKELRLNKEEKELVALAEGNGFEQWSYKSWRKHNPHADYSLTKSMVNKGEWSVVKKYCTGTKVKITSKDIEELSNEIAMIPNFNIRKYDTDNTRRKGTDIRECKS